MANRAHTLVTLHSKHTHCSPYAYNTKQINKEMKRDALLLCSILIYSSV